MSYLYSKNYTYTVQSSHHLSPSCHCKTTARRVHVVSNNR